MPTRWRPDTCGCELVFNEGPNRLPTFITRCPTHRDESAQTVVAEVAGKNAVLSLLVDAGVDHAAIAVRFDARGRGKRACTVSVPAGVSPVSAGAVVEKLAQWKYPSAFADNIVVVPRPK